MGSDVVVLNVAQTEYSLVSEAGRSLQWRLSRKDSDRWDVCWKDAGISPEFLIRMKPYQKVNHFPGMQTLVHKNLLAELMRDMRSRLPQHYDFCPSTWLLPQDYSELQREFNGKATFIVKPEVQSQGRGIYLVQKLEDIPLGAHYVVQKYLPSPLLLDGLKFDLRLYVLITGCDPLRVFLHTQGLARFATEQYQAPHPSNLETVCMHLTNYAINKESRKFIFNLDQRRDDVGHKRSLTAVLRRLSALGHDTACLWQRISSLVAKTVCSTQPLLAHVYRRCQPLDPADSLCFEVLGLDILLDCELRPWLLEVNSDPSFVADTPLDQAIKHQVLVDTMRLLEVSSEHRQAYFALLRDRSYQQVVRAKEDSKTKRMLKLRQEGVAARREQKTRGGFQQLLPSEQYQDCLEAAKRLWHARWHKKEKQIPEPPPRKQAPRRLLRATSLHRSDSQIRREGVFLKPVTLKIGLIGHRV